MTMIRTLLCTLLLSVASHAAADTLYRWTEPDGSLTFSPVPPPEGIAFDTVDTGGGNLAPQTEQAATQNLDQTAAAATPAPNAAQPLPKEPEIKFSAVPQSTSQSLEQPLEQSLEQLQTLPEQTLAYAPNAANALPQGITQDSAAADEAAPTAVNDPQGVVGSSMEFEQCEELQKRVVSLERRLRSKLSFDDVDNTVVAIVEYQSKFDRNCE